MSGDFGRFTLPYCSFVVPGETRRRVGVGVDTDVLDLTTAAPVVVPDHAELFAEVRGSRISVTVCATPFVSTHYKRT